MRGYLKSRKVLLCPTQTEVLILNNKARAGYYYNPWPAFKSAPAGPLGGGGTVLTTRFKKMKDVRKELPLVSEFFYGWWPIAGQISTASLSHEDKKTGAIYFNMAYADGHVSTANAKEAFNA